MRNGPGGGDAMRRTEPGRGGKGGGMGQGGMMGGGMGQRRKAVAGMQGGPGGPRLNTQEGADPTGGRPQMSPESMQSMSPGDSSSLLSDESLGDMSIGSTLDDEAGAYAIMDDFGNAISAGGKKKGRRRKGDFEF